MLWHIFYALADVALCMAGQIESLLDIVTDLPTNKYVLHLDLKPDNSECGRFWCSRY